MSAEKRAVGAEPLQALAKFSWDWAPYLCEPDHGCGDYHRVWSSIRFLQGNSALPLGGDFFGAQIRKLSGDTRPRILISGGADAGVLAMVHQSVSGQGVDASYIFVDQCETAVQQNRLYAAYASIDLISQAGNILAANVGPVDAVVAHSFINFFPPDKRQGLFDVWARNLRPGGVLLISGNMSKEDGATRPERSGAEIEDRKRSLYEKAMQMNLGQDIATEMMETAVRIWATSGGRVPVSEPEFRRLSQAAGLEITSLEYHQVSGISGPLGRRPSDVFAPRATVVARKTAT